MGFPIRSPLIQSVIIRIINKPTLIQQTQRDDVTQRIIRLVKYRISDSIKGRKLFKI